MALNCRLRIATASPAPHAGSVDCACVPMTCTLAPFTFSTTYAKPLLDHQSAPPGLWRHGPFGLR
jgi:hypothetical protein